MFGRDPFDPFGHMRRAHNDFDQMFGMMNQMDQMMNQMIGASFGQRAPMLDMLEGPRQHQRQPQQLSAHRRDPMNDALGLLGGFGFGGGGMMGLMDHAMHDPNSMVFSQSTMISMNPDGTQRVVSNSTRKAGDVKETRTALRDGEKERVAIGHHIGDRTHLIEKKRDRDGRFRQSQKFVNLDEEDAATFNAEFKQRASRNLSGLFNGGGPSATDPRRAIEANNSATSRYTRPTRDTVGTSQPIVTVPDDDEDDEDVEVERNVRTSRRNGAADRADYVRSNTRGAPVIRELSDEEVEQEASKRRRGLFGNFFRANDS